jgi:transposase
MDNLSPHKNAETLSLIQQLGAEVLFLPAYSPDLNPTEKMWSKLKELLRSAQARSQPSLIQAIGSALEAITAQDAINCFASDYKRNPKIPTAEEMFSMISQSFVDCHGGPK